MTTEYMLVWGVLWRNTADAEAGWELLEGLASPDPALRQLARDMLVQRRDHAMTLIEDAIGAGALTPELAGPCMVQLLGKTYSYPLNTISEA